MFSRSLQAETCDMKVKDCVAVYSDETTGRRGFKRLLVRRNCLAIALIGMGCGKKRVTLLRQVMQCGENEVWEPHPAMRIGLMVLVYTGIGTNNCF